MTHYTQDNREITANSIFIALPGIERDGHIFIQDALRKGAKKIVFHDESYKTKIPKNKQIYVLDTEEWLIQQAKKKIKSAKVITICGSVGKTTTTSLTYHLLKQCSNKAVFTPRLGINTLRGISLEIINKYNNEQLVVLEAGMDSFLELDKIAQVLQPQINAIISIDISHFEKLKSMNRILRTEFGMCTSKELKYLIASSNRYADHYLKTAYRELVKNKTFTKSKVVIAENSDLRIQPFHFTNNLNIALEILSIVNPKARNIQKVIDEWVPANNRFEIIKLKDKIILNDTYNAAPLSFKAFFDYSKKSEGKKLGVIGQINEIGNLTKEYHTKLYKDASKIFDKCIFVGKHFDFLNKKNIVKNYTKAIRLLPKKELIKYQFFGVKGSRGVALENVTNHLKRVL